MSEIVKKSIFIESNQKVYMYFSIVLADYVSDCSRRESPDRFTFTEPIETGEIFKQVDIHMPLLSVGDSFYFEDTQELVTINKVMRTDKDNVVYLISTKITYDEETKAQYHAAYEEWVNDTTCRREYRSLIKEVQSMTWRTWRKLKEKYN